MVPIALCKVLYVALAQYLFELAIPHYFFRFY
jgi:hypothetical protein